MLNWQGQSGTKHTALWCTREQGRAWGAICAQYHCLTSVFLFIETADIRLHTDLEEFGKENVNINQTTKSNKQTNKHANKPEGKTEQCLRW